MKLKCFSIGLLACTLLLSLLPVSAYEANARTDKSAKIVVNSTEDTSSKGDGKCTLREAIRNANADKDLTRGDCAPGNGADTIILGKKERYVLKTVDNGAPGDASNGLPVIASALTIRGKGSTITRGKDAPAFRIFRTDNASLNLQNLTLMNGDATTYPGGALFINHGSVMVRDVTFQKNHAASGGAIWNGEGSLLIVSGYFLDNEADYGGALRVEGGAGNVSTWMYRSTFEHNLAHQQGGAIYDRGTLTVVTSTFMENNAGSSGGAIYHYQDAATVVVSTLTGNAAENGGAAVNDDSATTYNLVTISANSTSEGGAFAMQLGTVEFTNTILANQTSGANCAIASGTVNDNGGNLRFPASDDSCVGTFGDPLLAPLADNGGPTRTMLPQAGSAAIDGGTNLACAPIAGTNMLDQRGVVRPQGGQCDVGAVETCSSIPGVPFLNGPKGGQHVAQARVTLDWHPQSCATEYSIQVRSGSKTGPVVFHRNNFYSAAGTDTDNYVLTTTVLPAGMNYFWQVTAYNEQGLNRSVWGKFSR